MLSLGPFVTGASGSGRLHAANAEAPNLRNFHRGQASALELRTPGAANDFLVSKFPVWLANRW